MNIVFKKPMTLTEAKTLLKAIKSEGGRIFRSSATSCGLVDNRNRSYAVSFKSNLELRNLIK